MITIPEHLEQPLQYMAEKEHKSADKLLEEIITDYLEDYRDLLLAEQTLTEVGSGEVVVLSLADAKKLYSALVD